MPVFLHDTMSREKRPLLPKPGRDIYGMYCCGPTVYGPAHIGNFRTFTVQDVLRRTLEVTGLDPLEEFEGDEARLDEAQGGILRQAKGGDELALGIALRVSSHGLELLDAEMSGNRSDGQRFRARRAQAMGERLVDFNLGRGIPARLVTQQRRGVGVRHRQLQFHARLRERAAAGCVFFA